MSRQHTRVSWQEGSALPRLDRQPGAQGGNHAEVQWFGYSRAGVQPERGARPSLARPRDYCTQRQTMRTKDAVLEGIDKGRRTRRRKSPAQIGQPLSRLGEPVGAISQLS